MIYPRAIPRQNGKVAEVPLKAKKFYRNISISEDTIEVLEAQKKSNWRVCVPITQRRPHVPGQRGPYAPPDAEASGPAQAPPSMILTQLRQSAAQSGHPHEADPRVAGTFHLCHHRGFRGGRTDGGAGRGKYGHEPFHVR